MSTQANPRIGAPQSTSGQFTANLLGQRVDERFEIVSLISTNATGAVYLAKQIPLERDIALKVIYPELLEDPSDVERILSEAKLLSATTHPALARLHDFGQDPQHKLIYLAMEHIQGVSVEQLTADHHRLDAALALELAHQALGALAELHTQGLCHHNIKPQDLIVSPISDAPQLRIVGLGKARAQDEINPLCYAPEQLQQQPQPADERADLYALGLVLYQMLSGYHPFGAPSFEEIAAKQQGAPAPPLSDLMPDKDLPDGLELLLMKLLAKDPQWRLGPALTAKERVEELIDQHRLPRVRLDASKQDMLARFERWRHPTHEAARQSLSTLLPKPKRPARKKRKTPHTTFVPAETLKQPPQATSSAAASAPAPKPAPPKLDLPKPKEAPLAAEIVEIAAPTPTPAPTAQEPQEAKPSEAAQSPEPISGAPAPQESPAEAAASDAPSPQEPAAAQAAQNATAEDEQQPAQPQEEPQPEVIEAAQETQETQETPPEPEPEPAPTPSVIIDLPQEEPAKAPLLAAPAAHEDNFFDAPAEPSFDADHIYVDEDYKEKRSRGMLIIPVLLGLVMLVGGAIALLVNSDLGKAKDAPKADNRGWSATPAQTTTAALPQAPPEEAPAPPAETAPAQDEAPPQAAPTISEEDAIKGLAPKEDAAPDTSDAQPTPDAPKEEATAAAPKPAAPSAAAKAKPAPSTLAPKAQEDAKPTASAAQTTPAAKVAPETSNPAAPPADTNQPTPKPAKKKAAPVDKKLKKNLDWLKRR